MDNVSKQYSMHGDDAVRRNAKAELLFFSFIGDLERCQKIVDLWRINLQDAEDCGDYDKRTPLHLAAFKGCYAVAEWLIKNGININAIDKFNRTPLTEAILNNNTEVIELLRRHGAKILDDNGRLIDAQESALALNKQASGQLSAEWEIDPKNIKLIKKIGEGEFGIVHKASWHGTTVAVKVLKSSSAVAIGDFKSELNVLQRCHHPHTVQFLGAVTLQEPFMIVTEHMNGGSLLDIFNKGYVLSMDRAIRIALDCARGMAYLHNSKYTLKIVHRDLKPANLMMGGHKLHSSKHKDLMIKELGVVKISDFGLSRSIVTKLYNRHAKKLKPITTIRMRRSDTVIEEVTNNQNEDWGEFEVEGLTQNYKMTGETGSYRYMAPEVFRHEIYNEKVDVYAFSMIFYQLLEGVAPFLDMDPVDAAREAGLNDMRPIWGYKNVHGLKVPPEMRDLVKECWSPSADDRPGFSDIVNRIQGYLDKAPKPKSRSLKLPFKW